MPLPSLRRMQALIAPRRPFKYPITTTIVDGHYLRARTLLCAQVSYSCLWFMPSSSPRTRLVVVDISNWRKGFPSSLLSYDQQRRSSLCLRYLLRRSFTLPFASLDQHKPFGLARIRPSLNSIALHFFSNRTTPTTTIAMSR